MPDFGLLDYLFKKGGHALGYGLLGLAYLRGLTKNSGPIPPRSLLLAWFLTTLYSATDEFHQGFVPGRHPALTDVLIDSTGAAVAMLLAVRFGKQK